MLFDQFTANFYIYFLGLLGIFYNSRNILIVLMAIELMLLSLNLNFVLMSIYLDDLYGQLFSFFILTIAAAESAIGLAIIIIYYRIRGDILFHNNFLIKS
jgi:NADH-quinone oxidoreductase subunit K